MSRVCNGALGTNATIRKMIHRGKVYMHNQVIRWFTGVLIQMPTLPFSAYVVILGNTG